MEEGEEGREKVFQLKKGLLEWKVIPIILLGNPFFQSFSQSFEKFLFLTGENMFVTLKKTNFIEYFVLKPFSERR